jgi:hypothetical protein
VNLKNFLDFTFTMYYNINVPNFFALWREINEES